MTMIADYTDQEYSLYEIINWAMIGLIDTVNPDRSDTFAGFLDDLYVDDRGSYLSGEPGWTLERITYTENFAGQYPFLESDMIERLHAIFLGGEREAFWMDNSCSEQRLSVLSGSTFWKVAFDSLTEFAENHPERAEELKLTVTKYPQLSREAPKAP